MINEAAAILPEAEVVPIRPSRDFLIRQSIITRIVDTYRTSYPNFGLGSCARDMEKDFILHTQFSNMHVNGIRREFRTLCARYNIEVTT